MQARCRISMQPRSVNARVSHSLTHSQHMTHHTVLIAAVVPRHLVSLVVLLYGGISFVLHALNCLLDVNLIWIKSFNQFLILLQLNCWFVCVAIQFLGTRFNFTSRNASKNINICMPHVMSTSDLTYFHPFKQYSYSLSVKIWMHESRRRFQNSFQFHFS